MSSGLYIQKKEHVDCYTPQGRAADVFARLDREEVRDAILAIQEEYAEYDAEAKNYLMDSEQFDAVLRHEGDWLFAALGRVDLLDDLPDDFYDTPQLAYVRFWGDTSSSDPADDKERERVLGLWDWEAAREFFEAEHLALELNDGRMIFRYLLTDNDMIDDDGNILLHGGTRISKKAYKEMVASYPLNGNPVVVTGEVKLARHGAATDVVAFSAELDNGDCGPEISFVVDKPSGQGETNFSVRGIVDIKDVMASFYGAQINTVELTSDVELPRLWSYILEECRENVV